MPPSPVRIEFFEAGFEDGVQATRLASFVAAFGLALVAAAEDMADDAISAGLGDLFLSSSFRHARV